MKQAVILLTLLASVWATSQEISGAELLEKSIAFHDPMDKWTSFNDTLQVTMKTPKGDDRKSTIVMNLPKSVFKLEVTKGDDSYTYSLEGDNCTITLNGSSTISEADAEKFRLSCERAMMYKNYYTYLYGLPMKLRDPGTIIHKKVERKTFKGKDYMVLKVNYTPEVGDDVWYFYFDPNTYAMEVYQFYHDEAKNDGEYILLEGLSTINGIKMPKTRKWYYNKDDQFLGVDVLE